MYHSEIFRQTSILKYTIDGGGAGRPLLLSAERRVVSLFHLNMEAKSLGITDDMEGKMFLDGKYGTQRAPKRLSKCLIKWSILFGLLLTIFFCGGGKFHRFTGGKGDMWLIDAFVQRGPLRGKVAEKLFL